MDDYFALANYNSIAQGIMGRAQLEGSAKIMVEIALPNPRQSRKFCGMGGTKEKSQGMVYSTQLYYNQNE